MTFVTFLMTHKRPVNINLFKIQLPLSALLSITHRISGILIFFIVLPVTAIALSFMYESQQSYDNFVNFYSTNFERSFQKKSCWLLEIRLVQKMWLFLLLKITEKTI